MKTNRKEGQFEQKDRGAKSDKQFLIANVFSDVLSFLFNLEISFTNDQYMVKVSESTRLHTVVSKLQARTFPDRRIITYALLSENLKTPTIFEINSRTGEIILSKRPDIREMRTFLLEIEASSFDGKKHRSAKAFVLINFSKVQSRGGSLSFTRSSFISRFLVTRH